MPAILPGGDLDAHLRARARFARESGCDGMIASGDAIGLVREVWPDAVIVSPGVRAAGRRPRTTKALGHSQQYDD